MRYWKSLRRELVGIALATLGLVGCGADRVAGADRPRLSVDHVGVVTTDAGTRLFATVGFQPSTVQLAALQHGIPLVLRLDVYGKSHSDALELTLTMRYFPLSRRYQMRVAPAGVDRNFALRGYMLDALQRLRLPLSRDPCAAVTRCTLVVSMDYSGLPGALRLPALVKSAWRVPTASHVFVQESS